jgi:hypothetical protein
MKMSKGYLKIKLDEAQMDALTEFHLKGYAILCQPHLGQQVLHCALIPPQHIEGLAKNIYHARQEDASICFCVDCLGHPDEGDTEDV